MENSLDSLWQLGVCLKRSLPDVAWFLGIGLLGEYAFLIRLCTTNPKISYMALSSSIPPSDGLFFPI